jgi:hypothetical protein
MNTENPLIVEDVRRLRGALHSFNLRWISFGSPSAIVTSMALIVGLGAATAAKATVLASLLIIGIADNLSDSLSIQIYQESERMKQRQAFSSTAANYAARFAITGSFIVLLLTLPTRAVVYTCIAWGGFLLSGLSYLLAKARHVGALSDIGKHLGVAAVVIFLSNAIGLLIRSFAVSP